jgi:phenylpyruvate tautomerase PptA (4-oxalocrotonate tautomerase family)
VGGRLLSEIEEPNYYCQFFDISLTQEKRERMISEVFPILMETLGLKPSQAMQIKILFQDCVPDNVVIGGHFVTEYLAALR